MRKSKPKKRIILPDPKFNDSRVTRFVNDMMWDGKKSTSFQIFYDSLEIIEKKMKDSEDAPIDIWRKALDNVTPAVEVKSRRIGGATFQVPTEIRADRKISVSHKWLIAAARKRSGQSMSNKLATEIMAAYNNEGAAVKRKDETHRMAEANKAFAHFKF
ncbi:MAG: 30S ribosomal protein S7 [Bacteroidales bacterium]|jgi:small subunit ribosomal protein S7|nr:30S ribosomal protein S7 [Bacteroidales bacterium]OQC44671.1 MAG: 30S ribosomal protein S7 [Bacteroidetes bacterium ADurb.Bin028]HNY43444.1 30S ribosomal protein S7 [Bacteroidales bacterium]